MYVFVPSIILSVANSAYYYSDPSLAKLGDDRLGFGEPQISYWAPAFSSVLGIAFQGLAIYLAIRWSRQHNRKYDSPTPQTS